MADPRLEVEVTIGILALQGAFAEHQAMLQRLASKHRVDVVLVRTTEDLVPCDGLIIPGGESTTIALIARFSGLLEPLREFVKRKPVWGTCAGAILLSEEVQGAKQGGQEFLGGVSITIARNGWGSQVDSFEAPLALDGLPESDRPFNGVFIRAPVILALHNADGKPDIQVIARLAKDRPPAPNTSIPTETDNPDTQTAQSIVAIRQGNHLLTTFHPELTQDERFHEYFLRQCVMDTLNRH